MKEPKNETSENEKIRCLYSQVIRFEASLDVFEHLLLELLPFPLVYHGQCFPHLGQLGSGLENSLITRI